MGVSDCLDLRLTEVLKHVGVAEVCSHLYWCSFSEWGGVGCEVKK